MRNQTTEVYSFRSQFSPHSTSTDFEIKLDVPFMVWKRATIPHSCLSVMRNDLDHLVYSTLEKVTASETGYPLRVIFIPIPIIEEGLVLCPQIFVATLLHSFDNGYNSRRHCHYIAYAFRHRI